LRLFATVLSQSRLFPLSDVACPQSLLSDPWARKEYYAWSERKSDQVAAFVTGRVLAGCSACWLFFLLGHPHHLWHGRLCRESLPFVFASLRPSLGSCGTDLVVVRFCSAEPQTQLLKSLSIDAGYKQVSSALSSCELSV
jgi:hypothetical protein